MMSTDTVTVQNFYATPATAELEHQRLLSSRGGRLEFALSLRAILGCVDVLTTGAPTSKALEVLDLGGGTGRYCRSCCHCCRLPSSSPGGGKQLEVIW